MLWSRSSATISFGVEALSLFTLTVTNCQLAAVPVAERQKRRQPLNTDSTNYVSKLTTTFFSASFFESHPSPAEPSPSNNGQPPDVPNILPSPSSWNISTFPLCPNHCRCTVLFRQSQKVSPGPSVRISQASPKCNRKSSLARLVTSPRTKSVPDPQVSHVVSDPGFLALDFVRFCYRTVCMFHNHSSSDCRTSRVPLRKHSHLTKRLRNKHRKLNPRHGPKMPTLSQSPTTE